MTHFKLFGVLPARLTKQAMQEINRQSNLWDQLPHRTQYPGSAHQLASDIWLRFDDTEKIDLYSIWSNLDMVDYPAAKLLPTCILLGKALLAETQGVAVGRMILTRLPPGAAITPHRDEGLTNQWFDRFHIVLAPGGQFFAGGEGVRMQTNEIWWFDNQQSHSVLNDGPTDRIHLIVDIRLNKSSPLRNWKSHNLEED